MSRRLAGLVLLLVGLWCVLASGQAGASVSHEQLSVFDEGEGTRVAVAVDNSGGASDGDVYVASGSTIEQFDGAGTATGLQITGVATPGGSFSVAVGGLAADGSAVSANKGDLYVVDTSSHVVDRFSEKGEYLCQITGAAVESATECNGAAGSKTPAGSMEPRGVAIGPNGDVYVSDFPHSVIDVFSPSGEYLTQIVSAEVERPRALAVDGSGDLYVAATGGVRELNEKHEYVRLLDADESFSLAADPGASSSRVYVSERSGQIAEYNATGTRLATFGPGVNVFGVAVSGTTGEIYASASGQAYIFGAPAITPNLTTGSATGVQPTSATLTGEVEPDEAGGGGEVTSCRFEYGTTTAYEHIAPCTPNTPYTTPTPVTAALGGLAPDTTYHYRLSATDAASPASEGSGEDETFTTPGPPQIDSEASADTIINSALVEAQIDPSGFDTTCQAQYVDEATFKASAYTHAITVPCTPQDLGSGTTAQAATASLTGLSIDTIYHYRFVATSTQAPAGVDGPDQTLATFGISSFSVAALDQNSQLYTQAGGHPYELSTTFALNTTTVPGGPDAADANTKDIRVELPPGLIGNPEATAKCAPYNVAHGVCSGAAQVGLVTIDTAAGETTVSPIYNLVPPAGVAAQFGARFNGFVTAHIDASVRTGGDYGVTANSLYISDAEGLTGATVTFWGIPADPSHDAQERYCPSPNKLFEERTNPGKGFFCTSGEPLKPFLTNPTSCAGTQTAKIAVDSWQEPGVFITGSTKIPAITGCDKPNFTPSITVTPESSATSSPTGLKVDLHIPQNENPTGLAEADLKDAVVTLPEGMTVNPSSANGLGACLQLHGRDPQREAREAKGEEAGINLESSEPANCPNSSKIGSVEIDTPLVDRPIKGGVYLATPYENPFSSLLALYIAVYDPISGVVVKVAGHVEADPTTGRLTTRFDENPQLPFEDLKVDFFGGPEASLKTRTPAEDSPHPRI